MGYGFLFVTNVVVSLAVSTQYTNVTDKQTLHDGTGRAYAQHRAAKRRQGEHWNMGS